MAVWQNGTNTDLPVDTEAEAVSPDEATTAVLELAGVGTDAADHELARSAFVFYDEQAPDSADGYLMPIAAVVDGELRVLPDLVAGAEPGVRDLEQSMNGSADGQGEDLPDGFSPEAITAAVTAIEALDDAVAAASEDPDNSQGDAAQRMRRRQNQIVAVAAHIRSVGDYEVRGGLVFDVRAVDGDDDGRTIAGHAATFWVGDDYGTVFAPKAFRKTLKDKRGKLPLLFMHDPASVVGPVLEAEEDDGGLRFTAKVIEDGRIGSYVYAHLKGGTPFGMSFGFRTIADRTGKDADPIDMTVWPQLYQGMSNKDVRVITEVELYELTTLPATFASNPTSTLDGIRSRIVTELHRAWAGNGAPRSQSARRRATPDGSRNRDAELIALGALAELGIA